MFLNFITLAQAAGGNPQGGPPSWITMAPIILLVIMIFFLFRSQKKQADQRKEMLARIKAGDEVITNGGIKGTVTKVKDKSFMIKIADKVEVEIIQNGIGAVVGGEKTDE